ncbi:hypothetical protein EDB83DRAFT_2310981 [Lactarius deliciosus]|nr:hypothetical protein EDB83DRAFT_2310981 [Lactarius deliciosus]
MTHVPEEVHEEDPLDILGRLIADKSKSLWKRVASKGNPSDKHAASGDVNEEATTHEEDHAVLPLQSPNAKNYHCHQILPTGHLSYRTTMVMIRSGLIGEGTLHRGGLWVIFKHGTNADTILGAFRMERTAFVTLKECQKDSLGVAPRQNKYWNNSNPGWGFNDIGASYHHEHHYRVTTTPSPIVVTEKASSTLDNGAVTVITIISTSTPPPSVVALSTSIVATPSQSQGSKSSIALAPIVGGAVGGFSFLVIVVVAVWFLLRKCCGSSEVDGDDDIVFPYPVTRDRDHAQDLDLSHEPKPYVYGLVGGSTRGAAMMAPQSSPSDSRASDGRPDSATALIGPSSGFTSMAMATGALGRGLLSSAPSAPSKGGEVGRQTSHGSISQLPPGAAAPSTYLGSSSGSGPPPDPSRYPLQVVNPPSIRSSFPVEMVGSSNSSAKAPLVVFEGGGQSARAEKKSASGPSSPERDVIVHTDGGRLPVPGHGLLASGSGSKTPAQPGVSNSDSPPAYVA